MMDGSDHRDVDFTDRDSKDACLFSLVMVLGSHLGSTRQSMSPLWKTLYP